MGDLICTAGSVCMHDSQGAAHAIEIGTERVAPGNGYSTDNPCVNPPLRR